ncbi:MAG: hypothetical protein AAGA30_13375 [Planctomycetota bacterium]
MQQESNQKQLFEIVENSNGVDATFEVRCIESNSILAVYSYWDARDEAFQHASIFVDFMNQFHMNKWGQIDLDGFSDSVRHHGCEF